MTRNTIALDALAERIRTAHLAYYSAMRKGLEHAIEAGQLLIEAKDGLPHGEWLPWLKTSCPDISARSAQRYMRYAKNQKWLGLISDNLADLTLWEAEQILSGRYLVPPDGCALGASWEGGEACIAPSAEHPGFFFITVSLETDDGGAVVKGLKRPVRADGVVLMVKCAMRALIPDDVVWETFRVNPWPYNVFFPPEWQRSNQTAVEITTADTDVDDDADTDVTDEYEMAAE